MAKIRKVCAEGVGRIKLDKAVMEFLRHCHLRNLSPRTIEYYTEDLEYFQKVSSLTYADEIDAKALEDFIGHEMDKGNRVTAINSRIRGLRVFIRFCADRDYMEGFPFSLLKEDQTVKEPYTDAELRKLLKRPTSNRWVEWRCWAKRCREVFKEVLEECYPAFYKYGVSMPELRIRNMETRWGSCSPKRGVITLNKRLLDAPRHCIEYVVTHELCHMVHPNHSKWFYEFLTMHMPDWRERKKALEQYALFWL